MVSLLASHVVCTSMRHADREKRCTGNLDYVQKLCMCSCIYKENLSIIQQQRHAHITKTPSIIRLWRRAHIYKKILASYARDDMLRTN
jgi:hypothetical protein